MTAVQLLYIPHHIFAFFPKQNVSSQSMGRIEMYPFFQQGEFLFPFSGSCRMIPTELSQAPIMFVQSVYILYWCIYAGQEADCMLLCMGLEPSMCAYRQSIIHI